MQMPAFHKRISDERSRRKFYETKSSFHDAFNIVCCQFLFSASDEINKRNFPSFAFSIMSLEAFLIHPQLNSFKQHRLEHNQTISLEMKK
ncbi:CLUMA_CG021610, isoform A [Clunio marinus]|uniref:CLUMA_CG021610, isoform A n=1 Tax=Clunio marinus TaxID=568069 RepID=A0A1J1J7P9_9DIPT|nr:CLUMA_CG021610, isoform A [Clunio marinus]